MKNLLAILTAFLVGSTLLLAGCTVYGQGRGPETPEAAPVSEVSAVAPTSTAGVNPTATATPLTATATKRPSPTPTPADGLPHPANPSDLSATLVPLSTLPPGAINAEEAIQLACRRFGAYADDYRQKYPPRAVSATFSSKATSGGPAAEVDNLPVWVVTIPGWGMGRSGPAAVPGPSGPGGISDLDAYTFHVETVAIIDAMTGVELASWGHGWAEPK